MCTKRADTRILTIRALNTAKHHTNTYTPSSEHSHVIPTHTLRRARTHTHSHTHTHTRTHARTHTHTHTNTHTHTGRIGVQRALQHSMRTDRNHTSTQALLRRVRSHTHSELQHKRNKPAHRQCFSRDADCGFHRNGCMLQ